MFIFSQYFFHHILIFLHTFLRRYPMKCKFICIFIWAFSSLLFQCWRTFINAISWSMYFTPSIIVYLIDIYVIFLFCDVLNSSKQEYMVFINYHRVTSSCLSYVYLTYGVFFCYILLHFLVFVSNFQRSSKVFCPFVPPKSQIFYPSATKDRLDLP